MQGSTVQAPGGSPARAGSLPGQHDAQRLRLGPLGSRLRKGGDRHLPQQQHRSAGTHGPAGRQESAGGQRHVHVGSTGQPVPARPCKCSTQASSTAQWNGSASAQILSVHVGSTGQPVPARPAQCSLIHHQNVCDHWDVHVIAGEGRRPESICLARRVPALRSCTAPTPWHRNGLREQAQMANQAQNHSANDSSSLAAAGQLSSPPSPVHPARAELALQLLPQVGALWAPVPGP